MSVEEFADTLARHAGLALLLIVATVLLLATVGWLTLQRYAPPLGRKLAAWNAALMPEARRLPHHAGSSAWPSVWRLLGIQAVISAAAVLLAVLLFMEIVDEIRPGEELARFDEALRAGLAEHSSPAMLQFFAAVTHLGDRAVLTGIVVVISLILLWRRRWWLCGAWLLATAGGGAVNMLLKSLFARERPLHTHGFAAADGWSFPSGHTSGSWIVYGLLSYLAVLMLPRLLHVPVVIASVALALLVGFSRVVLQVHYISDVLAGYCFATAWLAAWIAGLEIMRRSGAVKNTQTEAHIAPPST